MKICDFGQSKIYKQNKNYNPYTCSLCYRAPELFLGFEYYDTKIDMFSIGCIFGELFKFRQIICPNDQDFQFLEIMLLLGNFPSDYLQSYFSLSQEYVDYLFSINAQPIRGCNFKKYLNPLGHYDQNQIDLAADLIKKLLAWSPKERLSAADALRHPFFSEMKVDE